MAAAIAMSSLAMGALLVAAKTHLMERDTVFEFLDRLVIL
jgi:hypothetical protein